MQAPMIACMQTRAHCCERVYQLRRCTPWFWRPPPSELTRFKPGTPLRPILPTVFFSMVGTPSHPASRVPQNSYQCPAHCRTGLC